MGPPHSTVRARVRTVAPAPARAWLPGLQSRSLVRFVPREARFAQRKGVSLDEELPTNEDADAYTNVVHYRHSCKLLICLGC